MRIIDWSSDVCSSDLDLRQAILILSEVCEDGGRAVLHQRVAQAGRIEAIGLLLRFRRPWKKSQTDAGYDRAGRNKSMLERIFAARPSLLGIQRSAPKLSSEIAVLFTVTDSHIPCYAATRRIVVGPGTAKPKRKT